MTRRTMLSGLGMGALGGIALGSGVTRAGLALSVQQTDQTSRGQAESSDLSVRWSGEKQAGIDHPWTPQPHALMVVLDLPDEVGENIEQMLATLGRRIASLLSAEAGDELLADGALGLTVVVGLGPRLVAAFGAGGPGTEPLPVFDSDGDIDPEYLGGDLMLMLAADDPGILSPVAAELRSLLPGALVRWEQRGMRSPSEGPRARNPFGFHDGVVVPSGDAELSENVWFELGNGQATICVARRFRLDRSGFSALPMHAQEQAIGRRIDGAPLSGEVPFAQADLLAKTASGEYHVPARSHVRAAHPSFTGSKLMLRRSYAYDNGGGDDGLLFISYQRDLRSYVETQRRMDQIGDAMMQYATATASATFLVLPGFTEQHPLGSNLLAAASPSSSTDHQISEKPK